jgi:hypothetical protein
VTLLLTVLTKVSGTCYHEPSSLDARRRISAFFSCHVRTAPDDGVRPNPDETETGGPSA